MADTKSFRPSPAQIRDWAKWLVTSAIATVAAMVTTLKWIDKHTTDDELEQRMQLHDRDPDSHHTLLDRVILQSEQTKEMAARLARAEEAAREDRQAVYWAYWVHVGEKAAELTPDGRRRADAASDARDRFEAYYRQGMSPQEAFRRALRTPVP